MDQPTKELIITNLYNVLNKKMTREEFNKWAYKWVENFDSRNHLSAEEDKVHSYLIEFLAIDLEIKEGNYFQEDTEIKDWIQKIYSDKLL